MVGEFWYDFFKKNAEIVCRNEKLALSLHHQTNGGFI